MTKTSTGNEAMRERIGKLTSDLAMDCTDNSESETHVMGRMLYLSMEMMTDEQLEKLARELVVDIEEDKIEEVLGLDWDVRADKIQSIKSELIQIGGSQYSIPDEKNNAGSGDVQHPE